MFRLSARLAVLIWLAALAVLMTPVAAQTPPSPLFPLADMGSYVVGLKGITFTDASRDGREMSEFVWYPGIPPANPTKTQQYNASQSGWGQAPPDMKAAPYPLVLISPGWGESVIDFKSFAIRLASHGFVVVGLEHPDENSPFSFVNRPMDVLFALDQLAAKNQSDFGGVIDTDHVGVMGATYGAYTTLTIAGARIDPVAASALTAKPFVIADVNDTDPRNLWPDWNWDAVTTYRSKFSQSQSSELWTPMTDKRIMAAVMISLCFIPMFGENGLAAASVPSLIIGGAKDDICPYEQDTAYGFAHLGSQNRYLLTFVKGGHVPGFDDPMLLFTTQLITAFFEDYLKGQEDAAQYLTAKYVDGVEAQLKLGLVWGPYTGQ